MDLTPHRLVEYAIRAPSGENAQPWRFVSHSPDEIEVHIEVSRDESPYSWGHRSAYVALGAAIENIKIGAPELKKKVVVKLFPDKADMCYVALIKVSDAPLATPDALVACIEKRSTNRKPYKKHQLSETEIKTLVGSTPVDCPTLVLKTHDDDVKAVAEAGSTNERIMLANKDLHQYFFSHVNWSSEEDDLKKEGFFIKTLELPPPAVLGFKAMSSWTRAEFLNSHLKFNKLVQAQNAKLYQSSSGVGAIYASSESPVNAVLSGMSMQRVWLTATQCELAVQPLAGIPYLKLGVDHNHTTSFNDDEKALIRGAYERLQQTFGVENHQLYFVFRVGKADAPSAKAVRHSVEEVLSEKTL